MSLLVDSVLLADIGAANARFSLLSNGNLNALSSFEVAKFGQFTDALAIFTKEHSQQTQIHKALLAIAGPVKGGRVALTNSSWVIDISELQTVFGLEARVINDFEAVALSLPSLTPADLAGIGGGKSELGAPMAVLGPGTGLGVACLNLLPKGSPVPIAVAMATIAAIVWRIYRPLRVDRRRKRKDCEASKPPKAPVFCGGPCKRN